MSSWARTGGGERSLASAFWLVGVVGVGVVVGVTVAADLFAVTVLPTALVLRIVLVAGMFGAHLTAYLVFAWVAIWRCAWNTDWKGFGYVARFLVVTHVLRFAAGVWAGVRAFGQW
ncbi:MAG TPA: hypothetical protein VKA50_11230 [Gammaproteobacteria bacterium]|nr:hypothetical protein [Gammaproteobacteria bacterium]